MHPYDPTTIAQWAAAAVVALIAIALGLQTVLKNWKSNNTEGALLQMMHEELERMSAQNGTLSGEIGKLQVELIKLSAQLTALTYENQKLQQEVASLNTEISRLHNIMISKGVTSWPHQAN